MQDPVILKVGYDGWKVELRRTILKPFVIGGLVGLLLAGEGLGQEKKS